MRNAFALLVNAEQFDEELVGSTAQHFVVLFGNVSGIQITSGGDPIAGTDRRFEAVQEFGGGR